MSNSSIHSRLARYYSSGTAFSHQLTLRWIRSIFVTLVILQSVCLHQVFFVPSGLAEEPPAKTKPEKKSEPAEDLVATSGLYLGRVVEVDPSARFIFVRPLEGVGPRRTFYLDPATLLREQRKRVELKDIQPGRRVGVRYISEGDIAYAEGVFLIIGEVNPRDLQMPKKKPKVVPGEGEGKEKKAEKSGAKEGAKKGEH